MSGSPAAPVVAETRKREVFTGVHALKPDIAEVRRMAEAAGVAALMTPGEGKPDPAAELRAHIDRLAQARGLDLPPGSTYGITGQGEFFYLIDAPGKYVAKLMFLGGPLNRQVADVEMEIVPGETFDVRPPGYRKMCRYRLCDGPAVRTAIQTGRMEPNTAGNAEFVGDGGRVNRTIVGPSRSFPPRGLPRLRG